MKYFILRSSRENKASREEDHDDKHTEDHDDKHTKDHDDKPEVESPSGSVHLEEQNVKNKLASLNFYDHDKHSELILQLVFYNIMDPKNHSLNKLNKNTRSSGNENPQYDQEISLKMKSFISPLQFSLLLKFRT